MAKTKIEVLSKRELNKRIYVCGSNQSYYIVVKLEPVNLEVHPSLDFLEPLDNVTFTDFKIAQAVVNAARAEYARRYKSA